MDLAKVNIIINQPLIINIKDVQSFLGFANFYRRFIYRYSKLAAPLTNLIKKNMPFKQIPEYQKAFDTLKSAFTSETILRHYDPSLPIIIETDASNYISRGILSQYRKDGIFYLVAYFSKKYNLAECNYKIYNKELIVIIRAFEEQRPKLEGSEIPIDVITDYKNLEYFILAKQLSRR